MRGRIPAGRWLVAAFLLVLVGGGVALVAFARPLARDAVMTMLERAGLDVRTLEVRSIGFTGAEFGAIALGAGDGPSGASAGVSWTLRDLFAGRIDRLVVRQPRLAVSIGEKGVVVAGLPDFATSRGGAAPPFRRIEIVDGTITAATPVGAAVVNLDALVLADADGVRFDTATIRTATLRAAKGVVSVHDVAYRTGEPIKAVVEVKGVDLSAALALADVKGLSGAGSIDGRVPVVIDAAFRRVEVADGTLMAALPAGDAVVNLDAVVLAGDGGVRLDGMTIRSATLQAVGGTLSVRDVAYRPGAPVKGVIEVKGVDLAAALALLDVDGLSGTGLLDGKVPVIIDAASVRISDGLIVGARPGILRYTGDALPETLGQGDKTVSDRIALVRKALANFHYQSLTLGLDRAADGAGTLLAKLAGSNPGVLDGHPFAINLRLDTNFDKLALILLDSYAAASRLLRPSPAR